jgi:predicted nucleotidyltransferase
MFLSKDFIETAEGLIFAVVAPGMEQGKVLCFLRYVNKDNSGWKKVTTEQANFFLKQHYPEYLHYSLVLDAHLHAVTTGRIIKHHQSKLRLQQIMHENQLDVVERDLFKLCGLLQQQDLDLTQMGITGSLLIGVQGHSSDIDLVCYGRTVFHQCRAITRTLIAQNQLQVLSDDDWWQSYDRRSCDLTYSEYVWHERRKINKAVINGRKFDLSFIDDLAHSEVTTYQKRGAITLQCLVIDDTHAFDYPAEFKVDHEEFDTIVSFTATYTGQAIKGEIVEVSGIVEQSQEGIRRIVVGSSREAHGEYIKVVRA